MYAIDNDNINKLKKLIKHGANINHKTIDEDCTFIFTYWKKLEKVIEILLLTPNIHIFVEWNGVIGIWRLFFIVPNIYSRIMSFM